MQAHVRNMSNESERLKGTCKWFNSKRGYGFVSPADGSADHFVHQSAIINQPGFRKLVEGQEVEYELKHNATDSRINAVQVSAGALPKSRSRRQSKRSKKKRDTE